MTDHLRHNATLVDSLGTSMRRGGSALVNAPLLLRQLLEEDAWREFVTQRGEHVKHERFSEFVTMLPLKGLGADMDLVERIVGAKDPDLLRLLRSAKAVGQGKRTDLAEPSHDSCASFDRSKEQSGQAADRLARDHPEEYEQVKSGDLSLNEAAVAAGIRPRRVSIRTDNAESIAATLRGNVDPEVLNALIELLCRDKSGPGEQF